MIMIDGVVRQVIKCNKAMPYLSSHWVEVYYDSPENRGMAVGCISIPSYSIRKGCRLYTSGHHIEIIDSLEIKA